MVMLASITIAWSPSGASGCHAVYGVTEPVQSEDRPVAGPIRSIVATGGLHLRVLTAERLAVSVRCSEDILPMIETRVEGDVLRVGPASNSWIWNCGEILVTVALPSLQRLTLSGDCVATVAGVASDGCVVELSGGSTTTVRGSTRQLRLTCSGASQADLAGLVAEQWQVDCSGASSCHLAGLMQDADLTASGSSRIDALDLRSGTVTAAAHGASRIELGPVVVGKRLTTGAGTITNAPMVVQP
jgi:hypothetical protein